MKKIAIFALGLCSMIVASAQTPAASQTPEYQAELNKVINLQNSRENSVLAFDQAFSSLVKQGVLQQDKVSAMSEELATLLYPKIENEMKKLYSETFTLDELKQIAAWSESPVGKKMIDLLPKSTAISQELMQSPEVQKEIMGIVTKYMK